MNKKYFIDSISDETLAKMIDKTFRFEKSGKNRDIKISLLKAIPAAAAVFLIIGLINILGVLSNTNIIANENIINPGTAGIIAKEPNNEDEGEKPVTLFPVSISAETIAVKYDDTLTIGYINSGELIYRISHDGGLTWFIIPSENNDTLEPDPNISEIEWMTYNEFKTWFGNKITELSEQEMEWYESEFESLKRGLKEAAKIIIENNETIFVFNRDDSQEEQAQILALYEFSNNITKIMIDGIDCYIEINYGGEPIEIVNDDGSVSYKVDVFSYRFEFDDGEVMGFGATTYKELYEMAKNYCEQKIQSGKMTQEEAERKLSELSENGTRTDIIIFGEGNMTVDGEENIGEYYKTVKELLGY